MTIGSVYGAYGGVTFPKAVDFDGSTYLSSTSGVTGVTALTNQFGIFSFWLKRHQIIVDDVICASGAFGSNGSLYLAINSAGQVSLNLRFSGGGSNLIYIDSTATILDTNWHHVMVSYGANDGASGTIFSGQGGQIAIDDVVGTSISQTGAGFTLNDFIAFGIGGTPSSASSDICLAEFYYLDTQPTYVPLNTTNRRKFIDANGKAVSLGADGSVPFGAQPPIYMSGLPTDWVANLGDGGGFTENGTLKICNTRPR